MAGIEKTGIKESDLERLLKIAKFEESADMAQFRSGWKWNHVGLQGTVLYHLFLKGYLDLITHTGRFNGYRLSEQGKALVKSYLEGEAAAMAASPKLDIREEIFSDIIGHDDLKELLIACLRADKPLHVLLSGPPALAKSLFLWDIEHAAGERAMWFMGSGTSKSGLWDHIAEAKPEILLIDELDKMNASDTASLLSVMEGGRLVRAKRGRDLNLTMQFRVFAASNHLEKLSPELKSRFIIKELVAYSRPDYIAVVKGVLIKRENVPEEFAAEIARRLDGRSQDVRDAVKVARLAPQLGVQRAIKQALERTSR